MIYIAFIYLDFQFMVSSGALNSTRILSITKSNYFYCPVLKILQTSSYICLRSSITGSWEQVPREQHWWQCFSDILWGKIFFFLSFSLWSIVERHCCKIKFKNAAMSNLWTFLSTYSLVFFVLIVDLYQISPQTRTSLGLKFEPQYYKTLEIECTIFYRHLHL